MSILFSFPHRSLLVDAIAENNQPFTSAAANGGEDVNGAHQPDIIPHDAEDEPMVDSTPQTPDEPATGLDSGDVSNGSMDAYLSSPNDGSPVVQHAPPPPDSSTSAAEPDPVASWGSPIGLPAPTLPPGSLLVHSCLSPHIYLSI